MRSLNVPTIDPFYVCELTQGSFLALLGDDKGFDQVDDTDRVRTEYYLRHDQWLFTTHNKSENKVQYWVFDARCEETPQ